MLLVLPLRQLTLVGQLSQDELTSLLRYHTYTAVSAGHRSGFAALADLSACSNKEAVVKLVQTLERMQVGCFAFVRNNT